MLVKAEVMFIVNSAQAVADFSRINLLHYRFGFDIGALHMKPLLTILKQYELQSMRLLNIREGPNCFTLDAARPSKLQK